MLIKNRSGRPVFPPASSGFHVVERPRGHFRACLDVAREYSVIAELAGRIVIRRVPEVYSVSHRYVRIVSWIVSSSAYAGVLAVLPLALVAGVVTSAAGHISRLFK